MTEEGEKMERALSTLLLFNGVGASTLDSAVAVLSEHKAKSLIKFRRGCSGLDVVEVPLIASTLPFVLLGDDSVSSVVAAMVEYQKVNQSISQSFVINQPDEISLGNSNL